MLIRIRRPTPLTLGEINRRNEVIERRRYRNPPIEEALCEFRFKPSREWDLTIPGKLHTKLGSDYTGKPRQQRVVDVGFEMKHGDVSGLRSRDELARVQLVTENERRIVGVGPDVLSVHMLRPYQDVTDPMHGGWQEFRSRIENALNAYWTVANPEGINRISIRYINKIVFDRTRVPLGDYLKCILPTVPGLPQTVNGFVSRSEFSYDDGVRLILSQGTTRDPANAFSFVIDIDVIWGSDELLSAQSSMIHLDDLRDRERVAFEAIITDEARILFDVG
jgi:uncharacterized protein (TIGR04255 family)